MIDGKNYSENIRKCNKKIQIDENVGKYFFHIFDLHHISDIWDRKNPENNECFSGFFSIFKFFSDSKISFLSSVSQKAHQIYKHINKVHI